MKRVIKFRGKRLDNGEWCYGYYTYCNDTHTIHWTNEDGAPWWADVDPLTIGQCTGLYDRIGNEIYEGDIIELDFPNGRTDVEYVSFNEGRFVSIDLQKPYRQDALYLYLDCIRVIGNIHDNPEFLNTISK